MALGLFVFHRHVQRWRVPVVLRCAAVILGVLRGGRWPCSYLMAYRGVRVGIVTLAPFCFSRGRPVVHNFVERIGVAVCMVATALAIFGAGRWPRLNLVI